MHNSSVRFESFPNGLLDDIEADFGPTGGGRMATNEGQEAKRFSFRVMKGPIPT